MERKIFTLGRGLPKRLGVVEVEGEPFELIVAAFTL